MSILRMIAEMLQKQMRKFHQYEAAMHRYLAKPAVSLKRKGESYPTRAEMHERPRLR